MIKFPVHFDFTALLQTSPGAMSLAANITLLGAKDANPDNPGDVERKENTGNEGKHGGFLLLMVSVDGSVYFRNGFSLYLLMDCDPSGEKTTVWMF